MKKKEEFLERMFGGAAKENDHFGFKNYLARKPIYNDKVILNGNRLLFIEPLEASSVETYYRWTSMVCEWLFDGRSKRSILEELVESVWRFRILCSGTMQQGQSMIQCSGRQRKRWHEVTLTRRSFLTSSVLPSPTLDLN